ncbi:hypothetical protein L2E82_50596 [Cichorium intybus]|nr:hypothetical protein L2E82_50596 [Cichorium intybus]
MYDRKEIMEATMNFSESMLKTVHLTSGCFVYLLHLLRVLFLSWSQRLNLALDISNGSPYMHEHSQPNIAHWILRTSNILLDSTFKAKIVNFSAARPAISSIMLKVDDFAFGVILLELLSRKKSMESRDDGEICMSWKEIKKILEVEERIEENLRLWMDPKLRTWKLKLVQHPSIQNNGLHLNGSHVAAKTEKEAYLTKAKG